MIEHEFTLAILRIIEDEMGIDGKPLLMQSNLLEYINIKTRSANRGSKSRGSFANLYAIYVLVEDYIRVVYDNQSDYSKYEGAVFTDLLKRQRELPFGAKLQNHALNHRLNEEFHKYFPTTNEQVILRDMQNNRYWINRSMLKASYNGKKYDISKVIIKIIDAYIQAKEDAFEAFISNCEGLQNLHGQDSEQVSKFIAGLLQPNVDARLFEIVSFAILKYYYHDKVIFWGWTRDNLTEERLKLYKTGRTNANDGGIDFVMRPLGYFFQVTETLDVKKYLLDIDKLEHYPVRFVVKSVESKDEIYAHLRAGAMKLFCVEKIVDRYMDAVEDVINIPQLLTFFAETVAKGYLDDVMNEILLQSKVEFNYTSDE